MASGEWPVKKEQPKRGPSPLAEILRSLALPARLLDRQLISFGALSRPGGIVQIDFGLAAKSADRIEGPESAENLRAGT